MAKALPDITIIRDTREQKGWDFPAEEKQAGKIRIAGTIEQALDAGDYTIKGYEDLIRIERKYGFTELFGNLVPKEVQLRFEREMERLRPIPHKYIIIETSLSDDILGLSIPQMKFGPPASRIVKWLMEISLEYNVMPIFAGSCGKRVAKMIFDEVVRKYL
jgi:hypothetical protein